jgi:guanine deaminase
MPEAPPVWVTEIAREVDGGEPAELLDATVAIACESARRQHGPFGSLVADRDGNVVAAGHNRVVANHDSTAHAEITALRRAEGKLDTHDLAATARGPLVLYASCEPCIMCFGAIYWSGLEEIAAAARAHHAEALGFAEGPVTDEMWTTAREDKGIERVDVEPTRDPTEPFRVYEEQGGEIY